MTHLIEIINYQIQVAPELLYIPAFRKIWNKDRSKHKDTALNTFGYIYWIYDPRSDYNYIIDEDERRKVVIEEQGLPSNFKVDNDIMEAINCYKKHCITSSFLLLQDTRATIDNMRKILRSIDFENMEEKDKVTAIKNIASITQMLPKIAKDLAEAERAVEKEIEEQGTARGGNESKSLMDDGILMLE